MRFMWWYLVVQALETAFVLYLWGRIKDLQARSRRLQRDYERDTAELALFKVRRTRSEPYSAGRLIAASSADPEANHPYRRSKMDRARA